MLSMDNFGLTLGFSETVGLLWNNWSLYSIWSTIVYVKNNWQSLHITGSWPNYRFHVIIVYPLRSVPSSAWCHGLAKLSYDQNISFVSPTSIRSASNSHVIILFQFLSIFDFTSSIFSVNHTKQMNEIFPCKLTKYYSDKEIMKYLSTFSWVIGTLHDIHLHLHETDTH